MSFLAFNWGKRERERVRAHKLYFLNLNWDVNTWIYKHIYLVLQVSLVYISDINYCGLPVNIYTVYFLSVSYTLTDKLWQVSLQIYRYSTLYLHTQQITRYKNLRIPWISLKCNYLSFLHSIYGNKYCYVIMLKNEG